MLTDWPGKGREAQNIRRVNDHVIRAFGSWICGLAHAAGDITGHHMDTMHDTQ